MEDIAVITTDSDMYYDVCLWHQDNRYFDFTNKHVIIKFSVRDEEYIAEYDGKNAVFVNCKLRSDKVAPYYRDSDGNKVYPSGEQPFIYGYVECLVVHIPKNTFSESGIMKVMVCNITEPDENFMDDNQEVWSLISRTNIKYKSYE